MKQAILSILVICAAANLFAQVNPKKMKDHFPAMRTNRTATKTTATGTFRCIAMTQSYYNGASYLAIDSQTYAYSGVRGGSMMGEMKYDSSQEYFMTGGPAITGRTFQTFDSHNNILVYTWQDFDLSSGTYDNYWRTTYTYDAMNNPLTEINEYWNATAWYNVNKFIRTFTSANKVATETELQWHGTSWDNYYYTVYTYNGLQDPIVKIVKSWNVSTSTFDLYVKDTMVYDLSNNLTYDVYYNYDSWGNTWNPTNKTLYSNYLAPDLFRICIYQNWDNSVGAFANSSKDSFSYNSNNLPEYISQMEAGTGGTWVIDMFSGQTHLYYESYVSAVPELSNTTATFDIYPNPCNSQLNIAAPYRIASVSICNMLGQAICNYEFKSDKVQVNLNDLPSGAYVIRINGIEARKFVKQ